VPTGDEAWRRGGGRRGLATVAFVLLAWLCLGSTAAAATLKQIGTFEQPIFITSDPTNPERLLVVQRRGTVVEVAPSATRQVADLGDLVSCCEGERGLLSIAPAPDFDTSGRFYAAYTGTSAAGGQEGDVHVDSFRPGPSGSGQLVREPIISVEHSLHSNHNGGQLQFGPDGYLYVSLGDGGGSGDPLESGQDTETLLGKILRIDPRPGQSPAYAIPPGNPFVGGPGRDEIWAYGLRNPWRFSFDRLNGDMVIGDVGQDSREEVDFAPSPGPGQVSGGGANYGWNCREGFIEYPGAPSSCASKSGFAEPVFDYPHEDPGGGGAHGCAIIGGYVVRDASVADLQGRYVYADLCTGEIRSLLLPGTAGGRASDDRATGLEVAAPTSFGQDSCGRVYVASNDGPVYRIEGPAPAACPSASAPSGHRRRHVRLHLQAKDAGRRLEVIVRARPCAGNAGRRVRLNRGGRPVAVRRLDRHCAARFFTHIHTHATFRALLLGRTPVRSRRLSVGARRFLR
jgi:hypothetical protein